MVCERDEKHHDCQDDAETDAAEGFPDKYREGIVRAMDLCAVKISRRPRNFLSWCGFRNSSVLILHLDAIQKQVYLLEMAMNFLKPGPVLLMILLTQTPLCRRLRYSGNRYPPFSRGVVHELCRAGARSRRLPHLPTAISPAHDNPIRVRRYWPVPYRHLCTTSIPLSITFSIIGRAVAYCPPRTDWSACVT